MKNTGNPTSDTDRMGEKHDAIKEHEEYLHPREHAHKYADHEAYEGIEHAHIMKQRRRDHGYHSEEEGNFVHHGEKEQESGEHTKDMHTFHKTLRKVGHAGHPSYHHAK